MTLEEEEECYGVGLGLLLLVDVLLIDTVDDNAYCLVVGTEDWYCECIGLMNKEEKEMEFIAPIDKVVGWVEAQQLT